MNFAIRACSVLLLLSVAASADAAAGREILTEERLAAIRAETAGAGLRVLADGDVIRGRFLAEGFIMLPGSQVQYEDGAEIVSYGDINMLLGTFVPVAGREAGPAAAGGGQGPPPEFAPCTFRNAIAESDCGDIEEPDPVNGQDAPDMTCTIVGNTVLDADACFAQIGGGPQDMQKPPNVDLTGSPSICVRGGKGGDGADFDLTVEGNLRIVGTVENGWGADGAEAVARGLDGAGCDACGGHARAVGGNGGRPGSLFIWVEGRLSWTLPDDAPDGTPLLRLNPGGTGGRAIAHGGHGGNCFPACGNGGHGGHGEAMGGRGGNARSISINAHVMDPSPEALRSMVAIPGGSGTPGNLAVGGLADATSGTGGQGGPCPCGTPGGNGGNAGHAWVEGGMGGSGYFAEAATGIDDSSVDLAIASSEGARGGHSICSAGFGGLGAESLDCPCDAGPAAKGGDGGTGGNTWARGGQGGHAQNAVGLAPVISGPGGNANAGACGIGGGGGRGGSCFIPPHDPVVCTPGEGGGRGLGGRLIKEAGGKPGRTRGTAMSGSPGSPMMPVGPVPCAAGAAGDPGTSDCPAPPPACEDPAAGDCCVPNETPGCADAGCCASVCVIEPFCCEVAWDRLCAEIAIELCADCGGDG